MFKQHKLWNLQHEICHAFHCLCINSVSHKTQIKKKSNQLKQRGCWQRPHKIWWRNEEKKCDKRTRFSLSLFDFNCFLALNSALFLIWTKREQIWLCERYEWCACVVNNIEASAKSGCYLILCKNHQTTMIHILFSFFRLFAVHLTHFKTNENHNEVSSIPLSSQCIYGYRISGMHSWGLLQTHHTAFCCRHGSHYFLLAIWRKKIQPLTK